MLPESVSTPSPNFVSPAPPLIPPANVVLAFTVKDRFSPVVPRFADVAKSMAPSFLPSPNVTFPLIVTVLAKVRAAESPLPSDEIVGEVVLPRARFPVPSAPLLAANSTPSVRVVPPA